MLVGLAADQKRAAARSGRAVAIRGFEARDGARAAERTAAVGNHPGATGCTTGRAWSRGMDTDANGAGSGMVWTWIGRRRRGDITAWRAGAQRTESCFCLGRDPRTSNTLDHVPTLF